MANMRDFSLYVITGEQYHPGREMLEVIEAALAGGADIVQLRDKQAEKSELVEKARALRELTRRYGVPFIVNDHPDIALAADADGVHLGQDDMPIAEARRLLGPDRIIGISTHAIEQAREAQRAGADYLGVGPVYPTGTKPGRAAVTTAYVRQAAAEVAIPWVAIGGITPANAGEVLAAGATRLCAVSAIVGSGDPAAVCRQLRAQLDAARGRGDRVADTAPGGAGAAGGGAASPAGRRIALRVNGREERVLAATLAALVREYGLQDRRLVAELDGRIVSRGEWERTALRDGSIVELVHFVGGG